MVYHRTQVLLEPWQHARLKELARQRSTTLSQLVRQMVQRGLEESMGPPRKLLAMAKEGGVADGDWEANTVDGEIYRPEE